MPTWLTAILGALFKGIAAFFLGEEENSQRSKAESLKGQLDAEKRKHVAENKIREAQEDQKAPESTEDDVFGGREF